MAIITKDGENLIYEDESYILRGLWMKIFNELGPGHKEIIYQNAFEKVLKRLKISYIREPVLNLIFEGEKMGTYRPDFIVYNKIIAEFKSLEFIPRVFIKKVYQYLRSSNYKLSFIVNFGSSQLQIIRRVYDSKRRFYGFSADKADPQNPRKIRANPRTGFTLTELLIVIGILIITTAAAVPIYGQLQTTAQLDESAAQVVQAVRIARERSLAGLNDSRHGVYFEINVAGDDKFILYQGQNYFSRNASYDRAVNLDSPLSLSTTLVGNEINFSQGLGIPNTVGLITLIHNASGSREITINSLGTVKEE